MQTLIMLEFRTVPLDWRLGAFGQGEAYTEAARTERASYLPSSVDLVECQTVQGLLVLRVELRQEDILNVFNALHAVPSFQLVEGLLGLANVEAMSF
jgi:hypothetical protein